MTTTARIHHFAGLVALCGVLNVGAERIEAQGNSEGLVQEQEPCCGVVRIDIKSGIITVREKATGYTFRVEVKNRKHLLALKLGDKVWANFAVRTVRLEVAGGQPCCSILDPPAQVPPL